MEQYIISNPRNEWKAFTITVNKGVVVERSLGSHVELGADFEALKKYYFKDTNEYTVTKVIDGEKK